MLDKKIYLCILIIYDEYTKGIRKEKFLKLSIASKISQKEKSYKATKQYTKYFIDYVKRHKKNERITKLKEDTL